MISDGLESDKSDTWLMLRFRIVDIFYLSIINYIFTTNPAYLRRDTLLSILIKIFCKEKSGPDNT